MQILWANLTLCFLKLRKLDGFEILTTSHSFLGKEAKKEGGMHCSKDHLKSYATLRKYLTLQKSTFIFFSNIK